MKYVDEYRSAELARGLAAEIAGLVTPGETWRVMEVCGGHTHAIYRHALIYDYPFAAEEIKKHPSTVIARYNLNTSKYSVGVASGNHDLLNAINSSIDNLRSTPAYADLMREYLSSSSEAFTKAIPGRKTYTVLAGDTLSKIAAAQLGSADRWRQIWDMNRDRVANENLIYPRLVLLMP